MSVIACRCCMLELTFPEELEVLECPACGKSNARPGVQGEALASLVRATAQRLHCDFHNAEISYQHVLRECPEEPEALWGRLLCRYGVEEVRDPRTERRVPVVHAVRSKPMQEEGDFALACRCAKESVRAEYQAEAAYIDRVMARIRQQAESCPDYDVFLCHKTTVIDGAGYTEDCRRASELTRLLTQQGYRVFFAPETLEGEVGENYEAGIYHALDTARVMLVICSDPAHLISPWVESEWKRYLEMADERGGKRLMPLLYGDMSPEALPAEFRIRELQARRMGEMGAQEKLLAALERHIPGKNPPEAEEQEAETQEKEPPAGPAQTPPPPPMDDEVPAWFRADWRQARAYVPVWMPTPKPDKYSPEADFVIREEGDACVITAYIGNQPRVNVPPTVSGRPVAAVDCVFEDRAEVVQIWLPEGLRRIGARAFSGCYNMVEISIPDTVEEIGEGAFMGCFSLKRLELPEGLKEICSSLLSGCSGLESVSIPQGVARIGKNAFDLCFHLERLILPQSLESMEAGLSHCNNLREIILPAGNPHYSTRQGVLISRDGVLMCYPPKREGIQYLVPENVKEIGEEAFSNCEELREVHIPPETRIRRNAFSCCPKLKMAGWNGESVTNDMTGEEVSLCFYKCPHILGGYRGRQFGLMLQRGMGHIGEALCDGAAEGLQWLIDRGWGLVALPCIYGLGGVLAGVLGWLGWLPAAILAVLGIACALGGVMLAHNSIYIPRWQARLRTLLLLAAEAALVAAVLGWLRWLIALVLIAVAAIVVVIEGMRS